MDSYPARANRAPSAPAAVMPVGGGVARQVPPTVETVLVTLPAMPVIAFEI